MKKTILLALLLMPLTSFCTEYFPLSYYIKNPHASLKEIHEHFYGNYVAPKMHVYFQKKPDGWHVQTIDYSQEPTVTEVQLLWSLKTKKYSKLRLPKAEKGSTVQFDSTLNQSYLYKVCLFYGYSEWTTDVRNVMEGQTVLPDDYLASLARAYEYDAAALVCPHFSFQWHIKNDYDYFFDPVFIPSENIKEFIWLERKSISTYKRLIKQNPMYSTFVGSVYMKFWDEYMFGYHELAIIGDRKNASGFLEDSLFDEFFISAAKNILSSCDPNGILFTAGDNDTYPLLYVQQKLNFRKDVTLINLGLSTTGRYIHYLTSLVDSGRIKLTLKDEYYRKDFIEKLFIPDDQLNKTVSAESFLNQIKAGELVYNVGKDSSYRGIPGSRISFNSKAFSIDSNKILLKDFARFEKINIQIANQYYDKNLLFLIDLIYTNNWQRPIYFSNTVDTRDDLFACLKDFLILEGQTFRLMPMQRTDEDDTRRINTVKGYEHFKTKFLFNGIDKTVSTFDGKDAFVNGYRGTMSDLSRELLAGGQKEKALEIIELCTSKIPTSYLPYQEEGIQVAEAYYLLGKPKEGSRILEEMYKQYYQIFDQIFTKYNGAVFENYKQLPRDEKAPIYIYHNMKRLADSYSDTKIQGLLFESKMANLYK